ncbi:GGDEF domain-containing protein [Alteromonas sp. ASW11-130]|uniref:GGDEF domain-containing protein n=1 Tax=Alteromonas sp. ASW11-130 TaxID=3015775 RepID=UPI002242A098|nr:GGDEF domain-containing protein [Alteromonas sp. ASW11-130]MCW8092979.1 GGDEF domain-containing protein [Alteromonas sp. ASW11-130]
MEQVLPFGVAVAIASNLMVCLYFLMLNRYHQESKAYLFWACSCGLFSLGACSLIAAFHLQATAILVPLASVVLLTACYCLFIGLNSFELTSSSTKQGKKINKFYVLGLAAIGASSFFPQTLNGVTCLLMAAILLLTEGCFCRRRTHAFVGYSALRVILLGHAAVMLVQGFILLNQPATMNVQLSSPWIQVMLTTHLLLTMATALILPMLELTRKQIHWERLANTDELTGVLNRRAFLKQVNLSVNSTFKTCLLMIDIDHFKRINDNYGHQAGDEVLKKVARSLHTHVRNQDVVGRLGGEEFAILLPEINYDEAKSIADRILVGVANQIIEIDSHQLNITVSIGVAFSHQGEKDWDRLYSCADSALFQAKEGGRNLIAVYDKPLLLTV